MLLKVQVKNRQTSVLGGTPMKRGQILEITQEQYDKFPDEFEIIDKKINR
jgi:hypothetical protein